MYPNPAFDKAYFYIKPLKAEKIVLIEIYDSGGNKIMMQPAYTSKDTYDLDVTGFAAGVYSFKINCSNKTYSGTFSKFK
jgi:hypothetical protein